MEARSAHKQEVHVIAFHKHTPTVKQVVSEILKNQSHQAYAKQSQTRRA